MLAEFDLDAPCWRTKSYPPGDGYIPHQTGSLENHRLKMPFLGKNVSFLEGTCTKIEQINSKIIIWVFPKNRGVSPKMDGENNGKTLLKLDNLEENPIFGNIHITWHLTMFDWEQKHIIFIRVVVKMLVPDLCPYITAIPLGSRFKKFGKSEGFTLNHLFLGSYRFWKKNTLW